ARLLTKAAYVVGVFDGHLLTVTVDGTLQSAPFDERALELRGEPIPLMPNIRMNENVASIAISANGTMVFTPAVSLIAQLVWVARDGAESPINPELQKAFDAVSVSPRGDRVALSNQ